LHQASALVRGSCKVEREEARQRVFLPVSPAAAAILKTRTPTNLYNDAEAARRLDELREAWLNPPDLVRREKEVVPGFPDRILPVSPTAAAILKTRTLTNLYNARPAWLDNAHRDLDAAVAAAYGWPADIAEDDALARLLALNLERAAAGVDK
jgi:hypothetical protein